MSSPSRFAWLLGLLGFLSSCSDNVACIFTTGCQGGGGPISDNEAALPFDGLWILDADPAIGDVFPSGATNADTSPVVVTFSESMIEDTLAELLEIVPVPGGIPGLPVTGVDQALLGDGRVLVLLPPPLGPGEYQIRVGLSPVATDLTGQELDEEPGALLGSFTVSATPPEAPRLVMSYPATRAVSQSETTEIVVVFDRPVREQTVNSASFDVQVDGAPPAEDPPPTALVLGGDEDTRVFLYRSVDSDNVAVPLGTDASVELTLSPAGSAIQDEDQDALATTTLTFGTLALAAPLSGSVLSDPSDAIGLANLTAGHPESLVVEVELDDGQPGDFLDVFLFGEERTTADDGPLIAVKGFVRLEGSAPILSRALVREEIPLQLSEDPSDVRFEDGSVAFAFRSRRGALVTPVRVLDLDPEPGRILDPVLDTTKPTIASLLVPGSGTATFRSDQRGICIAGRASEPVRSVEVVTSNGDNGTLPAVIGSDEDGLFLAAPVGAGVLPDGTATYTIVAYDAALNPSAPVSGSFTQLGAVGPGTLVPGDPVEVEVFDSRTLAPLANAFVWLHSDQGNGVDFPFVQMGQTLVDGKVTLTTAGAPSVGAIVSVQRAGYDLFTFHGVPSSRLSVPLRQSNRASAGIIGAARSADPGVVALLPSMDQRFDDSRRPMLAPRGFEGENCTTSGGTISCGHDREDIVDSLLGAKSFYAGDFSLGEGDFSAALLLQVFALTVPLDRVLPGQVQDGDVEVPFRLSDPVAPDGEAAQAIPRLLFRVDPDSGVDPGPVADPNEPRAGLETLIPGIPGATTVAQGLSFDQGGGLWAVLAAQPGAITPGGSLGGAGIVDSDPFVRLELRDTAGNVAAARPRYSAVLGGGTNPEFRALATTALVSPAPAGNTGGQAFTLVLSQAIGDERVAGGLVRVELEDDLGRAWILWRIDPTGTGNIQVRAPDLGTDGLSDGTLYAQVSTFAWASFSATSFLWSDVEREAELLSHAAPTSFDKP